MDDEFKGDPTPLADGDFERAAHSIGCSVAAVRAVSHVESRGGYLPDGRPKILFERHKFHAFTGGRFDRSHSNISWPKPGGYKGGAAEYGRLEEAIALDRMAALQSASWGAFQLMGFNYKMVGFASVEDFVHAMVAGEGKQLDAFVAFIKASHLGRELVRQDWAGFARGYNGRNYRINHYDKKMADAFAFYSRGGARTDNPHPLLKMGSGGDEVAHLQELLGLPQDGDFGLTTKAAVIAFQKDHALHPDGMVGARTWAALLVNGKVADHGSGGSGDAIRNRPPLRLGARGADVSLLQEKLGLPADGIFGSRTAAAVKQFQRDRELGVDGIVGQRTWAALLGQG